MKHKILAHVGTFVEKSKVSFLKKNLKGLTKV